MNETELSRLFVVTPTRFKGSERRGSENITMIPETRRKRKREKESV